MSRNTTQYNIVFDGAVMYAVLDKSKRISVKDVRTNELLLSNVKYKRLMKGEKNTSLLIELCGRKKHYYLYIGACIYRFNAQEKILKYCAPIVSGVPYTAAASKNYLFYFEELQYINYKKLPNDIVKDISRVLKKKKADLYSVNYQHDLASHKDMQSVKNITIVSGNRNAFAAF